MVNSRLPSLFHYYHFSKADSHWRWSTSGDARERSGNNNDSLRTPNTLVLVVSKYSAHANGSVGHNRGEKLTLDTGSFNERFSTMCSCLYLATTASTLKRKEKYSYTDIYIYFFLNKNCTSPASLTVSTLDWSIRNGDCNVWNITA